MLPWGQREERGLLMHQGELGLSDWFVVSGPVRTTGKNYLSRSLALCSVPAKAVSRLLNRPWVLHRPGLGRS